MAADEIQSIDDLAGVMADTIFDRLKAVCDKHVDGARTALIELVRANGILEESPGVPLESLETTSILAGVAAAYGRLKARIEIMAKSSGVAFAKRVAEIIGGQPIERLDQMPLHDQILERLQWLKRESQVHEGSAAKLTDRIAAEANRLGLDWHGNAETMLGAVVEAAKESSSGRPAPPVSEQEVEQDGPGTELGKLLEAETHHGNPPAGFVQMKESDHAEFVSAVNNLRDAVYEPHQIRRAYAAKVIKDAAATLGRLRAEVERLKGEKETRVKYQGIVYGACNAVDRFLGNSPGTGIAAEDLPTTIREQLTKKPPAPAEASEGSTNQQENSNVRTDDGVSNRADDNVTADLGNVSAAPEVELEHSSESREWKVMLGQMNEAPWLLDAHTCPACGHTGTGLHECISTVASPTDEDLPPADYFKPLAKGGK